MTHPSDAPAAPPTPAVSPAVSPAVDPAPSTPPAPAWMKRVPLITGALAALAGYLTVHGAELSNNALYQSNQAVLMQTTASDKWAEFQADATKADDAEDIRLTLDPAARGQQQLAARVAEFRSRQAGLRSQAEDLQRQREALKGVSERRLAEKTWSDYAGVAAQLGIALASVAALTRRPAAFTAGVVAGLAAVAMTGYGLLLHFLSR